MMRIAIAAAVLAAASPAMADMSGLVGNTVFGQSPDGVVRQIWLDADGGYRISLSDGQVSTGRWSEKDGRLCYDRLQPPPGPGAPNPLCVEGFDGHGPGDRWEAPWRDGKTLKMWVVKGQAPIR
jgi:hypothetical protein